MIRIKSALLALLALAGIAPAAAQVPNYTLPPNTLVGRLGVSSGPAQAIPAGQLAPYSGLCTTTGTFPYWAGTQYLCGKVVLTQPASNATLTLGSGKTATINNTLTFGGTDGTTLTFQGTDTYVGRTTTDTLTNKTLTSPVISGGSIDNAPVGATTPNTGKFTNLQYTGTLTVPSAITVANGGTGSTNVTQLYEGLQAAKLGSAVISVNPGTWADSSGTHVYSSTSVLTANLNVSNVDFTTSPCTGGMVSGGLSVTGATNDGTDVMLYLIHRNSDGKVCLVGSNSNTYSGVQTQLNGVTGCSPNLCTVDRRVRFAFVWNWATNGGWSGIPDFQAGMGADNGLITFTGAGVGTAWVALNAGASTAFATVNLGSSSAGNPTTVAGRWLSNLNRRVMLLAQCNFGTGAGTAYVAPSSGGSAGIPVCASSGSSGQNSYGITFVQTDSSNNITYKVSGTGNTLSLYVLGTWFSDPS